jgi:predicted site-specific integrase-resolvase
MKDRDTNIRSLCKELNVSRQTLYRYVGPDGELREYGLKVLKNITENNKN